MPCAKNHRSFFLDDNEESSLILYFLLAALGGLLLNIMPCVLPILFLKIFDLMKKTGESRRNMLKWGLATAAGVGFSFFVLAALVAAIRLTGDAVGWGFQFQHPAYTATMALGLAVFALNLWGAFDIWMPGNTFKIWERTAKKGGVLGAFAYGVLLVLLSTPCSAPFLGTAVGFAFSASIVELFVIFAGIAIGLSLPYLILSIFPQWTKMLPKPGHWMVVIKQFLGFPLLLTVFWLIWVFYKQAGEEAFIRLCILLFLASLFAWLSGLIAKPGKPWRRFVFLWLIFILIYALSWQIWINPQASSENTERIQQMDSLQSEGHAVWVNGTASWCLNCKWNEKMIFKDEKVIKAFAESNVVKIQLDYTNSSPEALNFFKKYGRSAVPFDLLLTSSGEAILLPEVLTVNAVIEALEKAN